MVTKSSEKPKSQNTAFVYCTALYNLAISYVILSQIFDTARNAYCILSDQYTDNFELFSFMVVRAGIDQESSDRKKDAVCRILRFWLIMKI